MRIGGDTPSVTDGPFTETKELIAGFTLMKAVAPTLVHDITIVESHQRGRPLPAGRWSSVTAPALVMDGGRSPTWMRNAQRALAHALPNATSRTLPGQTHMVQAQFAGAAVLR